MNLPIFKNIKNDYTFVFVTPTIVEVYNEYDEFKSLSSANINDFTHNDKFIDISEFNYDEN